MIALLDSGIGGLTVARSLRVLRPKADLCYLADVANAPYGTKTDTQLLPLLSQGIGALLDRGAEKVVLACITASCLYSRLPSEQRPFVIPILPFIAESIAAVEGRVGMIATEATVQSDALSLSLRRLGCESAVLKNAAQPLVTLAEQGRTDPEDPLVRDAVMRAISPLVLRGVDTLVLGCTHFPYFEDAIRSVYGGLKILSPARIASEALIKSLPEKSFSGEGKFIYLVSCRSGRVRTKKKDFKSEETLCQSIDAAVSTTPLPRN